MPEVIAYRSDHPDVLAAVTIHAAQGAEFGETITALAHDIGGPDCQPLIRQDSLAVGLSAFTRPPGTLPDGMRVDALGHLVPNKRTAAGKAIARRMEDTKQVPHLATLLPGMPAISTSRGWFATPGHVATTTEVWVTWSHEPDGVDPEVWERAKLSAYYAAQEALAEAAEADVAVEAGAA